MLNHGQLVAAAGAKTKFMKMILRKMKNHDDAEVVARRAQSKTP